MSDFAGHDERFQGLAEELERTGAPPALRAALLHYHHGSRLLESGQPEELEAGQLEEAESSLLRALHVFRKMPGANSIHADSLALLGMVRKEQGRLARAQRSLLGALKLLESIPGSDLKKAACHRQLGQVHEAMGEEAAAEEAFLTAIALFGRSDGANRKIADRKIAECRLELGTLYARISRLEEAKAILALALEEFRQEGLIRDQARCHQALGNAQCSAGNLSEAAESQRQALALFETVRGSDPDVADCYSNLGTVFWTGGQWKEAEASYHQALDLLSVLRGTTVRQAACRMNLGNVYVSVGRLADAEQSYDVALELLGGSEEGNRTKANVHHSLSDLYRQAGRLTEAERSARTALDLYAQLGGSAIEQAGCHLNLANVHYLSGRLDGAEESFRLAIRLYETSEGTARDQARCHNGLGNALSSAGRAGDAEEQFLLALKLYEAVEGTGLDKAMPYLNLGRLYTSQGKLDAAESALTHAGESGGSAFESGWPDLDIAYCYLRFEQARLAGDSVTVDQLRQESLEFGVQAMLALEHARFQFPTERQRLAWDESIATSAQIAFSLAELLGDERLMADLVATSRASGVLEIAKDAERVFPLASDSMVHGAREGVLDRDPLGDTGAPTLTAGAASVGGLGLDGVFRRRPTPVLQMPDGRLALERFRGRTPEQEIIVRNV